MGSERFAERPVDGGSIPLELYLIFGFLGSGKTTLIKQLFSWKGDLSGTVVLVNEFGQVGLDGMILEEGPLPVIELTNGCICCSMKEELPISLKEIGKRFSPRRILVEATGVADPQDVLTNLQPLEEEGLFRVAKVISVLDSEFWEAREMVGPLFFRQLEAADILLLNKVDLLKEDQVALFLSQLHESFPRPRILPTYYSRIDPLVIFTDWERGRSHDLPSQSMDHFHVHEADKLGFVTFSFVSESSFREECFKNFLKSLPFELFRVKGLVCFPDGTRFLNFVGGKAEWQNKGQGLHTRLSFIGLNVDPETYIHQLEACLHG